MDLRYDLNRFRYINYIKHKFYLFKFKMYGAQILGELIIEGNCDINIGPPITDKGEIIFHNKVYLGRGGVFNAYRGKIEINENTYIGPGVKIYGHGDVTIGKKCLIAMDCKILSSNHTIPNSDSFIKDFPDILMPTFIDDDVWLGAGVIVLAGIKISRGCIVGAGAVVTKNLPPYSIAVGNPAKIIKTRTIAE